MAPGCGWRLNGRVGVPASSQVLSVLTAAGTMWHLTLPAAPSSGSPQDTTPQRVIIILSREARKIRLILT